MLVESRPACSFISFLPLTGSMSKRANLSDVARPSKKIKGLLRPVPRGVSQTGTRHIHLKENPRGGRLSQKRVDNPAVLDEADPDDEISAWVNEPDDHNAYDVSESANKDPAMKQKTKSKAAWVRVR